MRWEGTTKTYIILINERIKSRIYQRFRKLFEVLRYFSPSLGLSLSHQFEAFTTNIRLFARQLDGRLLSNVFLNEENPQRVTEEMTGKSFWLGVVGFIFLLYTEIWRQNKEVRSRKDEEGLRLFWLLVRAPFNTLWELLW